MLRAKIGARMEVMRNRVDLVIARLEFSAWTFEATAGTLGIQTARVDHGRVGESRERS
jgi:hypothetical protein